MSRVPGDIMVGVSIAVIPVVRARRNGGASKASRIECLVRDMLRASRYPLMDSAVIVTAPSDDIYSHKPKSIVAMASRAGASTTVLDPLFGRDARGVMLMQPYGLISAMPLILRRGIMQAVLTRSDLILPPSTVGNFVIACDRLDQPDEPGY